MGGTASRALAVFLIAGFACVSATVVAQASDGEGAMVQVTRSVSINVPVETVRDLVHFAHIEHPAIENIDVDEVNGKSVRTITVSGSDRAVVESLEEQGADFYRYRMLDAGPLPVMDEKNAGIDDRVYEGMMIVTGGHDYGSVVVWTSNAHSPLGVSAAESEAATAELYETGLRALKERLEAR